ncbi:hypothetical protein COV19_06345 [Candidatus Woesearchaeota archaeon CG10_big_fil_rev_8_21_14_0_10_44_13]|nr:MAG: hypothetical protein COV19_06345 [Candidatus Woesearchaeota archaeon CG10_big_fil_rev_8_21_14_0_10_44_13]
MKASGKNGGMKIPKKKDSTYAWISFLLLFFFWVPLLNLIILPASIVFGAKAIRDVRADPKRYGGKWIAIISVLCSAISFIFSVVVLYMDIIGKLY